MLYLLCTDPCSAFSHWSMVIWPLCPGPRAPTEQSMESMESMAPLDAAAPERWDPGGQSLCWAPWTMDPLPVRSGSLVFTTHLISSHLICLIVIEIAIDATRTASAPHRTASATHGSCKMCPSPVHPVYFANGHGPRFVTNGRGWPPVGSIPTARAAGGGRGFFVAGRSMISSSRP